MSVTINQFTKGQFNMSIKQASMLLVSLVSLVCTCVTNAQQHPSLILTQAGVEQIRSNLGKVPLFYQSL